MIYDKMHSSRKHNILVYTNQDNRLLDLLISFVWNYSLDNEVWKEIEGFNSLYYISNKGRILSLCCNGYKLINPFLNSNGYYYINLRFNKKDISYRVHRLVANSFLSNLQKKPIVHHKDCNKKNNNVENLMFLTREEHDKLHSEIKRKKQKSCETIL